MHTFRIGDSDSRLFTTDGDRELVQFDIDRQLVGERLVGNVETAINGKQVDFPRVNRHSHKVEDLAE